MALSVLTLAAPTHAETTLTPKISFKFEHNSNIFFDASGHAGQVDDDIRTLRTACDLDSQNGPLGLKLCVLADAINYRDLDELNTLDKQAQASMTHKWVDRYQLKLIFNHKDISKNDRADDLSLGTSRHVSDEVSAGSEVPLKPGLKWLLNCAYARENFENAAIADYEVKRFNSSLSKTITPRLDLNLNLAGGLYDYDQWINHDEPYSIDNVHNLAYTLSGEYALRERFKLKLAAGQRQTTTEYNRPAFNALRDKHENSSIGQLEIKYKDSRLSSGLQLSKDIKKTGSGAGTAQKDAFRFDLGFKFIPQMEGNLSLEYQQVGSSWPNTSGKHPSETVHKATPRLRCLLKKGFTLDLEYSYNLLRNHDDHLRRERYTTALILSWTNPLKLSRAATSQGRDSDDV